MAKPVPVMLLTGPVGVGKSATAAGVSDLLTARDVPHALIDLDYLRWAHPRPVGDPFNVGLGLRNLAAVWANCQAAGVERLVLVDVLERNQDLAGYQAAIPDAEICVIRLTASISTIHRRLAGREQGDNLRWHEARAIELSELMARNEIGDVILDTDGRDLTELAHAALAAAGWD